MSFHSGARLGPYQIVSLLGSGGMGEVYHAHDPRLNRSIAIKLLPDAAAADPERRDRFEREAHAIATLNHPNIVTIHSVERADGRFFLTMELVEGRTLADVLSAGRLPLKRLLKIAVDVATAIAAAHQKGITHRDLKPANIMLGEGEHAGRVKVLDFGLAKLADTSAARVPGTTLSTAAVTGEGRILGTVAYMSPEQAEGEPIDARSDLFSLGVVLYEMATGQRPFIGDTSLSIMSSILRDTPRSVTELNPALPADLGRIIRMALAKDPERRYQTAKDLRNELEEIQLALESGELLAPPGQPQSAPVRARRVRVMAAAGSAIVLVALAAAVARWWPWGSDPPASFEPVPLTSLPGSEVQPTFSPDGTQAAFVWRSSGLADVYLQVIGVSTAPLRLTNDGATHSRPSWSPDGKWIAVWHSPAGATPRGDLKLISPIGGPEREFAKVSAPVGPITWSADGRWLAVSAVGFSSTRDVSKGIVQISLATGEQIEWASLSPALAGAVEPAFSPDGRQMAFTRTTGDFSGNLYVVSIGSDGRPTGEPRMLAYGGHEAHSPVWTADGRDVLLIDGSPSSNSSIVRVRVDGSRSAQRIGGLSDVASSILGGGTIALSRDGRRLAFSRGGDDYDIWRVDLQNAAASATIARSSRWEGQGIYSPDGQRIAFSSNRSGPREIWVADARGDNAQQLTNFGGPVTGTPRWSPDGQSIAFDSRPNRNADIFIVPATGGAVRRLTDAPGEDARPAWSLDGRSVYFASDRSGRNEIWRVGISSGELSQVTRSGGTSAVVAPDGSLYYRPAAAPLAVRRVRPDASHDGVVSPEVLSTLLAYTPHAMGLWFMSPPQPPRSYWSLRELRFADGLIREVFRHDAEWQPGLDLSVSPDGRYMLLTRPDSSGADLFLVENFR